MPATYTTRLAMLTDAIFLREMVYEAAIALEREKPLRQDVLAIPSVSAFVEDWGRPGDHGIIAETSLEPVGAAWFRIFPEDDPEGGFVGGVTPEMIIAVERDHRGHGVGALLLSQLIDKAREEGMPSLGLNVPRANLPAVSLFRRFGFESRRDAGGTLSMQKLLA